MKNAKLRFPNKVTSSITPLNICGLSGRMLSLEGPKASGDMLFIYGHHASLERYFGIAEDLSQYAAITMPDLPGFGGMDSFHGINEEVTVDAFADYLAAFIKYRYKKQPFSIAAMSLGFAFVTRMLQKYPDITKQVTMVISIVGFSHYEDFSFSKTRTLMYKTSTAFFKQKLPAVLFRTIALNSFVIRYAYKHTKNARTKFATVSKKDIERTIQMEILLWQSNEVRTYMATAQMFFSLDLTKKQLHIPLHHISVGEADQYFNETIVEQHLRCIYSDCSLYRAQSAAHAPTVIADAEEASAMIPKELRKVLSSLGKS